MGKKNTITIRKKALLGIMPVIAISAVLFAKNKAPEVLLFLIGVGTGIYIGKALFDSGKKEEVKEESKEDVEGETKE